MIEAGDKAPPFALRDKDGNEVTLEDFAGQQLVLYFYPKALTPGCTSQACGIREHRLDYDKAGAVVVGVSPDEPEQPAEVRRQAWARLHPAGRHRARRGRGLRRLDREVDVRSPYWGNERTTFMIDRDGTVTSVLRKVKPKTHDQMVLSALAGSDMPRIAALGESFHSFFDAVDSVLLEPGRRQAGRAGARRCWRSAST